MVERTIILPTRDNAGASLARRVTAIRREVLALAGGFSETRQHGQWVEQGKVYRDVSIRLVTTVDSEQDAALVARLAVWCEQLRQVCLYTHATQVSADFVYPAILDTANVA
jgi:hypothetical protein